MATDSAMDGSSRRRLPQKYSASSQAPTSTGTGVENDGELHLACRVGAESPSRIAGMPKMLLKAMRRKEAEAGHQDDDADGEEDIVEVGKEAQVLRIEHAVRVVARLEEGFEARRLRRRQIAPPPRRRVCRSCQTSRVSTTKLLLV